MSFMSSYSLIRQCIERVVLPPGSLLIGIFLGLALSKPYPHLSKLLLWGSAILLYLALTPIVGNLLLLSLNHYPPVELETARRTQAIVVLTGGVYYDPQVEAWMLGFQSWQRMNYAATLHHKTGRPLLLTGGKLRDNQDQSEAEVMQRALRNQQVPVKWVETQARNTAESATYTAKILLPQGHRQILLVTHAFHMPRSIDQFQRAGFDVLAAPFGVRTTWDVKWIDLLPSARGLNYTSFALHEVLGRLWYRWRLR